MRGVGVDAHVLGIPFDFTAEPVVAPPQPPMETVEVRAVVPERDACELRFPRVQGYRVELPEERLSATFSEDSTLELTPELVGPTRTRNQFFTDDSPVSRRKPRSWSVPPAPATRASSARGWT